MVKDRPETGTLEPRSVKSRHFIQMSKMPLIILFREVCLIHKLFTVGRHVHPHWSLPWHLNVVYFGER